MSEALLTARVEARDLAEILDKITVLDVRSPAEFESVHIPGSFSLPLDRLPEYVGDLRAAVDRPVVLVCRSGQRAREAGRVLEATDLPGLHVLDGGLISWESAGLPVRRGKTRWSMERQVRGTAGAIVLASAAGSLIFPPLALVAVTVAGGLLVSAVTDSCAMARVLGRLPYNKGACCDVRRVLGEISVANRTLVDGQETA